MKEVSTSILLRFCTSRKFFKIYTGVYFSFIVEVAAENLILNIEYRSLNELITQSQYVTQLFLYS